MTAMVGTDVLKAGQLLKAGKLVAFATETVYGLGANALDPLAVARVFEVKGRPRFDPLIVHLAELSDLESLVTDLPPVARQLAARFWPGPLTLVLPKSELVPDLVTSGLSTVAVRIPDHPMARELLKAAGVPIAAPSANPFGRLSPTCARHVVDQLGDRIEYVLDGGPCRVGVESTVLDVTATPPRLLRPGGVSLEEIEAIIGRINSISPSTASPEETPLSPGMLAKHYAPHTPVLVVDSLTNLPSLPDRCGLLTFSPPANPEKFHAVEILSATGHLPEAAAGFFSALRRLDAGGLHLIVAIRFPEIGLGRALNDRLRRAAQPD